MESSKGIPSLNLEDVETDSRDPAGNESSNSEGLSFEDGNAIDKSNERNRKCEFKEEKKEGRRNGERHTCSQVLDGLKLPFESFVDSSYEMLDNDSLSASSEYSSGIKRNVKNSKMAREKRLKRHHSDQRDNCGSNVFPVNEFPRVSDFTRLYVQKRIAKETDKHLSKSGDRIRRRKVKRTIYHVKETAVGKPLIHTILEENKKLKKILSRERRHHVKEKSRIRQVFLAIDDALSSLPNRLGKIRIQNHKNLMETNMFPPELCDLGDYRMLLENQPKIVWAIGERDGDSPQMKLNLTGTSISLDKNIFSTTASTESNSKFSHKMKSFSNSIQKVKKGQQTAIETVLRNELYAISLLKNEIKCTKQKIEQKCKADSENSGILVTNWNQDYCEVCPYKTLNIGRKFDLEEMKNQEKYVCLHKKTMNSLSLEVQRVKELINEEVKKKEGILADKKTLQSKIIKLNSPAKEKTRGDILGNERPKGYVGNISSDNRPFRIIKNLKSLLEEKEKILATFKARLSRIEAAAHNKGMLLENERRKNAESEGKLKIVTNENKSLAVQLKSFQFINSELKKQIHGLEKQVEVLMKQKAEFSCHNQFHLKENSTEVTEALKNVEMNVKQVRDEAKKKLKELENRLMKEMDSIRVSCEKSEKMNAEYLRTFKALLTRLHNYKHEKMLKVRRKDFHGRTREILSFFQRNMREDTEKQVEDLYQKCHSLIVTGVESEFSVKLSAWLFDFIKNTMTGQNYYYHLSD